MQSISVPRIKAEKAIFFQCDIQAPKEDHYPNIRVVIENAKLMNKVANILDIPLIITEQNSTLLGNTRQEIKETYPKNHVVFQKLQFSGITPEVKDYLNKMKTRNTIILYGLEAHVCVMQTALDLIENGYIVFLVLDCIDSVMPLDMKSALTRMKRCNVNFVTGDMIVWELLHEWPKEKGPKRDTSLDLYSLCQQKYAQLKKYNILRRKQKLEEQRDLISPKL